MAGNKNNQTENKEEQQGAAGALEERSISEEMQESYIDYAMSVIVSRALPDARDGLKPVQRRILYTMHEDGLRANSKFRKSANVVGGTLGRYHPHGDVAVYDAMVRMAQDFVMRYPLVDGQGNMGSIDGDPPAAQRYTEARMSALGQEMLRDIEKETVDFVDNYDGTRQEPSVLPAPVPQLLLNGAVGIAVGMATSVPPHNLTEVVDALIHLIDNPEADTKDLLTYIKGPDFPTGGIVYAGKDLAQTYAQGKGKIWLRGKADIEERNNNRSAIVITAIPYQVQKTSLLERFAKLVEEKRLDSVRDIRDESDKEGLRIVLELKSSAYPKKVLNKLYKYTDLQKAFHLNLLALDKGIQPRVMSLAESLQIFLDHRVDVVTRRTQHELDKAKARAHILEGLYKCLSDIDAVIETIKRSKSRETAQKNLMKKFELSEKQADAVLQTRLRQLARLEREAIEQELKEKRKLIEELTALLNSEKKIRAKIKEELQDVKTRFGDKRQTTVRKGAPGELSEEDLIPNEETLILLTQRGYIKRVKPESYRSQKRGGKGVAAAKVGDDDMVEHFVLAQTHDLLYFFTDTGKVFRLPAYEIPETSRNAKGKSIMNFIEVVEGERILNVLPRGRKETKAEYLFMATEQGRVKKTKLSAYDNVRSSGLIAIKLRKGDSLCQVTKTTGEDDIVMVTKKGQSVRFKEKDVRAMGRNSTGLQGMKLGKDDKVITMRRIPATVQLNQSYLLTITEKGVGKKTPLSEYRLQNRGGKGIKTHKLSDKTGDIAFAKVLTGDEEELLIVSSKGKMIRTDISSISEHSRVTQGVKLINLAKDDTVSSAICT